MFLPSTDLFVHEFLFWGGVLEDNHIFILQTFAFFEKATADKLLVRRKGELHFTALATDIESFLFGPPGTILAENKYGDNATAAVNAIRHASKSKLN